MSYQRQGSGYFHHGERGSAGRTPRQHHGRLYHTQHHGSTGYFGSSTYQPRFRTQNRSMSPRLHSDSSSNRSERTTVSDPTNYRLDPRQAARRPASYPGRDSDISRHNHRHRAQHNQDSGEDIYERGQFHQLSRQHMSERTYRNRVSRHHQHATPPHHQHAIMPYRSQHRNRHPRHQPAPPQRHRRHPQPRQGHRQRRSPSPVSRREALRGDPYLGP